MQTIHQTTEKKKRELPENMNIVTVHEYRNFHRYLYLNGEEVSALAVVEFRTSLGDTKVKTAGIGNVRTPEEHRKKGYMRILMEDTVHYMEEQGYDISVLIGIPHFYHKYDYAVSQALHKQKLDFDFIPDFDVNWEGHTIKPMEVSDFREMVDLYNRNNAGRPGSMIRHGDYFGGFGRGSDIGTVPVCSVFRNDQGELVAYYVSDVADSTLTVCELECLDSSYYFRMLDHLKGIGAGRSVHDIDFVMAMDHPFIQFIQRFGITVATEFPQNGMIMSRICNLEPLFEKMLPELERRLRDRLGSYTGELSIATDLGTVTLKATAGILELIEEESESRFVIPQKHLIQLMSGYRNIEDLCLTPDNSISCDNRELAGILSPERAPFLWPTDYF